MKKTLLCLAAFITAMTSANAQTDLRLFNHVAVGLNVGTTGIGADIAVPCTKYLEIQGGFSMMPKIKINTNIHTNLSDYRTDLTGAIQKLDLDNIPIQGKLNMVNGKVMLNVFPFPQVTSFHVTLGAYFGRDNVVEVYNTKDGQLSVINQANEAIELANQTFPNLNQEKIGLVLDDYLLTPDASGNAKATLKTKSFKPYVGIGIGRAIPKRRVNFKFDLGAMFWGTPDVVDHNGHSFTQGDFKGNDGGAIRIIKKIKVYPVLNFRVSGRIF